MALRHIARILLKRAESVGDREQKRRLDRQAFALVREAMRLQLGSERNGRVAISRSQVGEVGEIQWVVTQF